MSLFPYAHSPLDVFEDTFFHHGKCWCQISHFPSPYCFRLSLAFDCPRFFPRIWLFLITSAFSFHVFRYGASFRVGTFTKRLPFEPYRPAGWSTSFANRLQTSMADCPTSRSWYGKRPEESSLWQGWFPGMRWCPPLQPPRSFGEDSRQHHRNWGQAWRKRRRPWIGSTSFRPQIRFAEGIWREYRSLVFVIRWSSYHIRSTASLSVCRRTTCSNNAHQHPNTLERQN